MAETSRSTITIDKSYYNNGALVVHMDTDNLFSIMLLLPVETIVSFAMTCKRFLSLSRSTALWESICRRDWGSFDVDMLKSSVESKHHQIPWMRLYKQVAGIDSVSSHKFTEFLSQSLVLFRGGAQGGRRLDDTWAAYIGNEFQSVLNWQIFSSVVQIGSNSHHGRREHTCVAIGGGDSLVVFGGIKDNSSTGWEKLHENDTWLGQKVCHESLPGITLFYSWRLFDVGLTKPPARWAHAACLMGSKMVIHGGIGMDKLILGDTWVLDLSDNLSSGKWREIVTHQSPPARSGHTLTSFGETRMVLFGGRGSWHHMHGDVLGDVWIFNMGNGFENWEHIMYEMQNIPEGMSIARVGHSARLILGGRVLICGGVDWHRKRKDDFWVLDVNASITTKSINNSNLKKSCIWKKLKSNGYVVPERQTFYGACKDRAGLYLYVTGGMVDGVLQPAEAARPQVDRNLFLVELSLQV